MISNSNRIHSQNIEVLFCKCMWTEYGGITWKMTVPFIAKLLPSVLMIYSY